MFLPSTLLPFIATVSLALLSAHAQAQNADRLAAIEALQAQGLNVMQEFDAGEGLRGFAGVAGDQPVAVYVLPDGKAIVGTRIDAQGKVVDETILYNLVAKPLSDQTWAQLESATWIQDGKADAPRIIYTFTDANCPYCHRLYQAARPWVDSGKVQFRHLIVGVISQDSPAKAAAILGADDPSEALRNNALSYDQGGITPSKSVPDNVLQSLENNQNLMLTLGFRGTPGSIV